jgi:RNA polymerase sigma-70 factor (ECF subfamily)
MKDPGVLGDSEGSGTSLTLLERVRRSDQAAWERLVSLYTPLVYHWCLRCGLQPADAEEVSQEVFLAVARGIGDFRHDREGDSFRGWLRTITRNKVCDHRPPPGGQGVGGSDVQGRLLQVPAGAEEGSEVEEAGMVYRRAVELIEAEFEPSSRRAFWLLLGGRRPADVAADLGLSTGAVYIAKSRILKRLRDEFRELLEPPVSGGVADAG